MKTSEFIRGILDLGYRIEEYEWVIEVWDNYKSEKCVSIAKYSDKSVYINTNNYSLIRFCMEYVETPIAEREEVKKYTVVVPDPRNTKDFKFMLVNRHDEVFIGWCHKSHLEGLTEEEIKRNHSYLWQFREEIK